MALTKSQLFTHVHSICRMKNVAYFGGYHKAFAHFLRESQDLVYSFQIVEPARTWA